jgi:hypothetical protein
MEDWRRQEFDKLYATGYLQIYSDMAMNMNVPFWWSRQAADQPPEILGNGTVCLVDTGTSKIGVTCDHVYQEFLDHCGSEINVEAQFGSNTISPSSRLIARDKNLDLATFDLPEVQVYASRRNFYHTPPSWPPPAINTDDVVLYGGYPQSERRVEGGRVNSGFQYFITRVNDVLPDKIVLEPGIGNLYWPGHVGERINDKFGGHSGGPVYRVIDGIKGESFDRVELVGFIYNRLLDDLVLAKHVRHVKADGTLAL